MMSWRRAGKWHLKDFSLKEWNSVDLVAKMSRVLLIAGNGGILASGKPGILFVFSILGGPEWKYWPDNDGHTTDLSLQTTEIRNGSVNNGRSAIVTTWSSVDVGASDSRPFLDHIHLPMRPNGGQLIETDILLTTRTEEEGESLENGQQFHGRNGSKNHPLLGHRKMISGCHVANLMTAANWIRLTWWHRLFGYCSVGEELKISGRFYLK